MTFMIPALQSADTFPQAKACAPRRCGGGKVSAGWGYLLLSRRGSPFRFRWSCLGVSVALFCRAVGSHGAVFTRSTAFPTGRSVRLVMLLTGKVTCDRSELLELLQSGGLEGEI